MKEGEWSKEVAGVATQEDNTEILTCFSDDESSGCILDFRRSYNIEMWDGMTRMLSDVKYVPVLKNNLISLGTLGSKGCVIQADDGDMKVKKGQWWFCAAQSHRTIFICWKVLWWLVELRFPQKRDVMSFCYSTRVLVKWANESCRNFISEIYWRGSIGACKLSFCKYCMMGK